MLKARFRLLLGRIQSHSLEFIVNAFRSACCLHNMILDHDGNMTAPAVVATYEAMSDQRDYTYGIDEGRAGRSSAQPPIDQESPEEAKALRQKLIDNLAVRYSLSSVVTLGALRGLSKKKK